MPSADQDVTMWQGEDRLLKFDVQDDSFDATAATSIDYAIFDIAGTPVSKSKSGGSISAPDANTVEVTLVPGDTSSVEPGTYRHELKVSNAAGQKAVVAEGTLTLKRSVS